MRYIYIYIYVCVYACVYACVYVCVCARLYIYIYIYIFDTNTNKIHMVLFISLFCTSPLYQFSECEANLHLRYFYIEFKKTFNI